ncbi:hypothetical protein KEH51_27550 [[Brevibacterium] frigoritolerans]|uniref:Uncharacterized protein n=1 Tax=Peribacillus frigoritolerans TaxID=450367 RepID=A0A941FK74_9BACI|nr:hypothetical protein [Peribacillus frigoritolerans]
MNRTWSKKVLPITLASALAFEVYHGPLRIVFRQRIRQKKNRKSRT